MGVHLSSPRRCNIQLFVLGQGQSIRDHAVHKAGVHPAFKVTVEPSQDITCGRSSHSLLGAVGDGDTLNMGFASISPFSESGVTPLRLMPTTPKCVNEVEILIIFEDGNVQFPNTRPQLGYFWDWKNHGDDTGGCRKTPETARHRDTL